MAASVEAFAESAMTTIVPASARPIISAEAVAAVRRGLRSEFWPASIADGAEQPRGTTAAASRSSGRLMTGLAAATPEQDARGRRRRRRRAAWARRGRARTTSETRPPAASRTPNTRRRRIEVSGSAMSSLSACTGAIRPTRRAGKYAATMVTSTPTTYDAMTVRGPNTSGCPDRSRPNWPNSTRSAIASSTPSPSPIVEPSSPSTNASSCTDQVTCRREAPEGAQQGELAAALGDQDRERVDDDERPDDQRDAREDQQERGDEADRLEQVVGRVVGRLVTGDRLDVAPAAPAPRRPAAPPATRRPRRSPRRRCRRPRRPGTAPGRSGCPRGPASRR